MRHPITTVAVLILAGLVCAGVALAQTVPGGFTVGTYGTGGSISSGSSMAWAPDGRLFVCEQTGAVRIIKNGALLATPFLTMTVDSSGERGMLGIAFDPNFTVNHYIYLYFTNPSPASHNCIHRVTDNPATDTVVAASEVTILDLENLSSATNHNGGAIHFGPDGKLYAAVGENANSANAQSISSRLGKILRYNPDGSIPADNSPSFSGIAGSTAGVYKAIWAVGLRNPFTFAFQPGTGRMFINDVGENTWEEINDGLPGLNYGWQGGATDGVRGVANMTDPVYTYAHGGNSRAITGGAFYNPGAIQFPASYVGKYFYAEYVGGWINYIDPAAPATSTAFLTGAAGPVDVQTGPDGALYFLAHNGPGVYRIGYTGVVVQNIIVSTNQLTVNEGSTASFNVRLAKDPGGPLAVTVANTLGSGSVSAASPINFTSGNWSVDQSVTVTAAVDADSFDSSATLTLSAPSVPSQSVVVTAVDTNPAPVAGSPTARIALPVNGQGVGGATAEFFGYGTPATGFATVKADFYVDGVLASTDVGPGHYHFGGLGHNGWNTTGLTNGTHVLRMTVTDNNGVPRTGSHEITVIVSNTVAGAGGGGGGGGGCGTTGLEPFALLGLLGLLRGIRRRS